MSYERFITDIENGANGKFEKLYFKYPGKSLEDGLRFIFEDSTLVDLLFHYLHQECVEIYGEYFDDEVGHGEGGEGIGASDEGTVARADEGFIQGNDIGEGADEGIDCQGEEIDLDSEHSDFLVDAMFLTDDEDKDDEDLVEGRNNIRKFHKRATKGWIQVESSTTQRSDEVIAEADYQTDYYETDGDESLDSNVEEEDVDVTRRKSKFLSYDPNCATPFFTTSMKFDDGRQFKDALKKYSVVERREIKFIKNERKFVRAKCADENCSWKISASFDARSGSFHVKTYHEEHTCSISFTNKRVTSSWLAKHYLGLIRAMPTMKTAAFKELIKDQLGLNVSMNQCTKAKLLAFEILMGNYKNEYAKLWDYVEELRATNPGSMITLKVEKPNIHSKALFERMYICFAACKKGFGKKLVERHLNRFQPGRSPVDVDTKD
ncbi:uncharacterized protein J3R85_003895 [Psidium guajava]|nr:uncharacterized protein J3R85_003895 [Psidium guajava]